MAVYYARKSGNVNATDVWATTPSGTAGNFFPSFTNQDTLMSNNFTITLNVNTTVLEIRNDTTGGATAGGTYNLNDGVTLTSNIVGGGVPCLTYSGSSPNQAYIIGNITAGAAYVAAQNSSTGTLNITGSIIGGSVANGIALYNSVGIMNIVGNIIGGQAQSAEALRTVGAGTTNVIGNIIGSATSTLAYAVNHYTTGATINVTGNVIGAISPGIYNAFNGAINITGSCIGGSFNPGVVNSSSGSVTVIRVKGNGFGPGSVGLNSVVGLSNSQTGSAKVYEIEYGDLGQSPTSGPIEMVTANSNVAVFAVRFSTKKTLVDLNNSTNLVPSSGNVRNGTSYNYGNNIGSCVIPNANSVVYGVPVGNTVGSGLLSPVAVWNALTSSIGTTGSIGERLKNVSTVSTVGKQLEGVL